MGIEERERERERERKRIREERRDSIGERREEMRQKEGPEELRRG